MAFQAVQLEAGFAIDTRRGNDWFLGYLSGLVADGDFSRKNSWYILWFCWYLLYEWSVYQCVELMYTNRTINLLFCEKQFRQRCNICNRSHKKTHGTVYWEALSTFVISIRVNKLQPRWTLLQWVCQQFSGTSKDFWIWSLEQIILLLPQVLHSESQISKSAFQGVSFGNRVT